MYENYVTNWNKSVKKHFDSQTLSTVVCVAGKEADFYNYLIYFFL